MLDWKIWEHYENDDAIARWYNDKWMDADEKMEEYFDDDDDRALYYSLTD